MGMGIYDRISGHSDGTWDLEVSMGVSMDWSQRGSGNHVFFFIPWNYRNVPGFQWPCQEPKLAVPTIYKAYVREYPSKIWPYMVLTYLHFRILKISHWGFVVFFHHPILVEIEVDIINPNHWSSRGRRIPPCSRNRLFCWWNTPGANLPCPATQLKPWGLIAVVYHQVLPLFSVFTLSGWWFGTYIGNNDPNWRMFFRGVETTNQIFYWFHPQFVLNSCSPPRTKQASRVVGFKHLVFLLSLSGGADVVPSSYKLVWRPHWL